MLSPPDTVEEASLLIEDEQPTKDASHDNWIQDMTTFLSGGGYPQGLDRKKRRQFRL
jgi:hypothetical protein